MEDMLRYLDEIVVPTIADFEANPMSTRHAFLACVTVAHAVDYLAHPAKPAARRGQFKKASRAFRIVDDIAHAFKHVEGDGLNPMRANDVIARPPAFAGVMVAGLSRLGDAVGGVTLQTDPLIDLREMLYEAVVFLRGLSADGLRPRRRRATRAIPSANEIS